MGKLTNVWIFVLFVSHVKGEPFYGVYYKEHVRDPELGKEMLRNLARILHRVKNSAEFDPLKLSVCSLTGGYEIADSITKYLGRLNLTTYQADIDNLSRTSAILKYVGVTWIIVVDNFQILYRYVESKNYLWDPASKFIIVFVGYESESLPKLIFDSLWRKYKACKVLVTLAQENFRCLYKYSPFVFYHEEYGTVEKVYLDASEVPEGLLEGSQEETMKDIGEYSKIFKIENQPGKLIEESILKFSLFDRDTCTNIYTVENGTDNLEDGFKNWTCQAGNKNVKVWKDPLRIFEDFTDLNNYPLNVAVFNSLMMNISTEKNGKYVFSGMDAEALRSLKKYMNSQFRIKVIPSNSSRNDPFLEGLHRIENGNIDISITGYFMKNYQDMNHYKYTVAVFEDKLCLLAPSSGPVPKYAMPFTPFSRPLWYLLLAYNVIVAVLWHLVKHYGGEVNQENHDDPLNPRCHWHMPRISRGKIILSKLRNAFKNCQSERIRENYNGMHLLTSYRNNPERRAWKRDPLHKIQTGSHVFPQIEEDELDRVAGKDKFVKQPVTPNFSTNFKTHVAAEKLQDKRHQTEPPDIHACLKIFVDIYINIFYPLEGGKSSAQRFFLCNVLLLSIVVVGLYQSCLVSTLSKPMMRRELHTLADVAETDLTIVTKYDNLLASTFSEDSPVSNILRKKMKTLPSNIHSKDYVAFSRKAISLTRLATLKLEDLTSYYDQEGNKLIHVVEEYPSHYMLAYVVGIVSPYLDRIDALLLRMIQAGLFNQWCENMIYPIKMKENRINGKRNTKDIKLTLSHYSLTFLVLLIGLFGCTLVFLTELYIARNWKRSSVKVFHGRN
ncbi:Ionotropic receptor 109 [Cephus cinctus]|uniref:Uncharacterized protein LOC107265050 n=1 Tax=Cephus cinctus TaxID=211228 RepID=A0A3L9LUF7_CEPCN|nr:uncharacterized protein LOC107265050 [Cephus cinctus]XP_015589527.1 uncharacterized protein LOC107265050 [Cephus cinctus]XP_015589536.1 uncharacterized protein LOC107265050 [Cephus cinctus]XP_024947777.1 uncharacterized protein LOC107265050 [Cephus cinctus]XP_024947781.1 uncharacterized protein LOC107265050 [Cephus cinctus]XP_024947789.1 uncharacterized protein LOC107265050 [Cephus cinctus]XP_024947794.1 uncharacterized protein LOC107265050 [Cephus cinctus]XP_024947801.1 uncharacterized p